MTQRLKHSGHALPTVQLYTIVLLVLAAVSIILQAASLEVLKTSFWGFHLYAFLPRAVAILNWVSIIIAAIFFLRPRADDDDPPPSETWFDRHWRLVAIAGALLCFGVFWTFRSQQTVLGDGQPLITDLPNGKNFHPRQPVTMWLQHMLYQKLGGMFRVQGMPESEVARSAVAFGSSLAGFFYTLIVIGLSRLMTKGTAHVNRTTWLLAIILLAQGYVVLFFGYIENYAYLMLFIGLYLLTALLYLKNRLPLAIVALASTLALGLHFAAVALLPSFLFLVAWGLRNKKRRIDVVIAVVIWITCLVALDFWLKYMSPGFSLSKGIDDIIGIARKFQGGGAGVAYTFSSQHARDFFNEQFLIGPLAALLFVPAFVFAVFKRRAMSAPTIFLSIASFCFLVGSATMSEPLLGYARDWDLFAPAGVCYATTGLYFFAHHVKNFNIASRLALFMVVFSILNFTPWIRINNSELLSLERMKTLPLGKGRAEVVVGHWYWRHGAEPEALEWFDKAIGINPRNANAYGFLGNIFAMRGEHQAAADALENAVAIRPDKFTFRNNYARSLVEIGNREKAVEQFSWLVQHSPRRVEYWLTFTDLLGSLERTEEWQEAADKTLALLDERLQVDPNDRFANIQAGVLFANVGRNEKALVMFRRVLAAFPDSDAGLYHTGALLFDTGQKKEGEQLLRRFLELFPEHELAGEVRARLNP